MSKKTPRAKSVDLKIVFGSLQDELLANLKVAKAAITHPGTHGTVAENRWRKMFTDHLPARYCATEAFVVDSNGRISDQIDLVVYDHQYSPFILNTDGAKYVTAESVYAVFEIRPTLNAANLSYAAHKIQSVRVLKRTSVPIPYAAGKYKPKRLTPIVGGILCRDTSWAQSSVVSQLQSRLGDLELTARLDIGCVLTGGSFEATYKRDKVKVAAAVPQTSLIFFMLAFLARLQEIGTVAAIDLRQYAKNL